MIQQVGKGTLKPQPHSLRDMECLRQSRRDGRSPGPLQDAHGAVSHGPHGIGSNAPMSNMLPVARFAILPLPMQSGRWNDPR